MAGSGESAARGDAARLAIYRARLAILRREEKRVRAAFGAERARQFRRDEMARIRAELGMPAKGPTASAVQRQQVRQLRANRAAIRDAADALRQPPAGGMRGALPGARLGPGAGNRLQGDLRRAEFNARVGANAPGVTRPIQPPNPALGVYNASPVTQPSIGGVWQGPTAYLGAGPWQPGGYPGNAATTLPGNIPPPTQPGQPTPTQPAPQVQPNAQPTPQPRLNRALDAVSVRLDRLSAQLAGHVPTPGGVAPLIATLLILLAAVVPVSAGGATRLKLLWEVLTGVAFLPGVTYTGVGTVDQGESFIDTGAPNPSAPAQAATGTGGGGGIGGLGHFGTGQPLRIPTSLPIGPYPGTAAGPLRFGRRVPMVGGQHTTVAQTLTGGQMLGSGGASAQPLPFRPKGKPKGGR